MIGYLSLGLNGRWQPETGGHWKLLQRYAEAAYMGLTTCTELSSHF